MHCSGMVGLQKGGQLNIPFLMMVFSIDKCVAYMTCKNPFVGIVRTEDYSVGKQLVSVQYRTKSDKVF